MFTFFMATVDEGKKAEMLLHKFRKFLAPNVLILTTRTMINQNIQAKPQVADSKTFVRVCIECLVTRAQKTG